MGKHRHPVLERSPFPWRGALTLLFIFAVVWAAVAYGDAISAALKTVVRTLCPIC